MYLHKLLLCFLGQPQSFTVSVRPADNFPADFYLLIDKSNDDLQNLKSLSSQLGVCVYMCMHTCVCTCTCVHTSVTVCICMHI